MDWLIPASELKLATMPRWSWSLATAIARGLWLQEVRIWQSHPGSPRLLLGAREIGRSWWCFDNEDIFFLILFLQIVFWTRSRHCVAWGANAFERTSASMCEPKMQSLVTCCFLVRGQFLLKLWFFMIFHRYFSDLLRSSQIFSACPVCSKTPPSFGSRLSFESNMMVLLRPTRFGRLCEAPGCRDHPVTSCDHPWPFIFLARLSGRNLLQLEAAPWLCEFWASWNGFSTLRSRCHSCCRKQKEL